MKVYEATIGVPDLDEAAAYFANFGYREIGAGALDADAARALYGHASGVRSRRLQHGDKAHGLIRLMQWDTPANEGLGLRRPAVLGGRWVAQKTDDFGQFEFHVHLARDRGLPIRIDGPVSGRYAVKPDTRPFLDAIPGARDVTVAQPYWRQLIFSWFHMPQYGTIDQDSVFRASEIAHVAMVIQGEEEVLDFYVEAFGMTRAKGVPPGDAVPLDLFGVPDKTARWHKHFVQDAENPALGDSISPPPGDRNGGRMMVVRFGDEVELEDCRHLSQAGCLGMAPNTVRTDDLDALHGRVAAAGGTDLTDISANEFGERSCTFKARDGYGWFAVEN
jgi:catechol 2,3-dioxygenase-like lactoylglutathione lyase family enzyme